MTTDELYDLMEDGNLGYACVYKQGDQGMHTDYMFKMTLRTLLISLKRMLIQPTRLL